MIFERLKHIFSGKKNRIRRIEQVEAGLKTVKKRMAQLDHRTETVKDDIIHLKQSVSALEKTINDLVTRGEAESKELAIILNELQHKMKIGESGSTEGSKVGEVADVKPKDPRV